MASRGVTLNLEEGDLTSLIPKVSLQLKSITLPSGEQPKIGILGDTKRPVLSSLLGFPTFLRYFSYSFQATGSYFLACSNTAAEIGFCAKRSATNFSWFLCLLKIFPKLGALNRYFHSCSHSMHPACCHVFPSSLFASRTFIYFFIVFSY